MSFCRWGMHLPGVRKVFHRGHLFTRCAECDATLIASRGGWVPLPRNKRVTWRPRRPDDRLFAITPNSQRRRLPFSLRAALRHGSPGTAAREAAGAGIATREAAGPKIAAREVAGAGID